MAKKKEPEKQKEVRIDNNFYIKCATKLNQLIMDEVFSGDTKMENPLMQDVLIVVGEYLGFVGRSLLRVFNPEELDDVDKYYKRLFQGVLDIEELWETYPFGLMVAIVGSFLSMSGQEMAALQGDLPTEAPVEEIKEVDEDETE